MLTEKIHHAPEDIASDVSQTANTRHNFRAPSTTNTEYVEDAVHARPHRLRVIHIENRRRVNKDNVVHLTQFRNDVVKVLACDNF